MAQPETESPSDREVKDFTQDEDVRLMQAVAAGEEAALTRLIERWQNPLINFFYRSTGSREDSEDLTQTLFVRIYRAAPRYRPTARFSTFLFSIARRLLINEIRRARRKPVDLMDPEILSQNPSQETDRQQMEIEEAFQSVIATLPERQRSAILLFKQQELSYQEIAEVLQTTESSVKTWIFRARQKLRLSLKDILES